MKKETKKLKELRQKIKELRRGIEKLQNKKPYEIKLNGDLIMRPEKENIFIFNESISIAGSLIVGSYLNKLGRWLHKIGIIGRKSTLTLQGTAGIILASPTDKHTKMKRMKKII